MGAGVNCQESLSYKHHPGANICILWGSREPSPEAPRGRERESPGMTFPRDDICLLIPLRSVSTVSPELQICRSSCGEGNGTLLQYSCLENPMDGGAWWAEIHGVAKSQTRLHFHFSLSCIGEGNGNPLQCSCLENPRDGVPGGLPYMGSHRSDMTEVT